VERHEGSSSRYECHRMVAFISNPIENVEKQLNRSPQRGKTDFITFTKIPLPRHLYQCESPLSPFKFHATDTIRTTTIPLAPTHTTNINLANQDAKSQG